MTNADRIRMMTDEELAYFLTTTSCSICCDNPLNCGFDCASQYTIKAEKTDGELIAKQPAVGGTISKERFAEIMGDAENG